MTVIVRREPAYVRCIAGAYGAVGTLFISCVRPAFADIAYDNLTGNDSRSSLWFGENVEWADDTTLDTAAELSITAVVFRVGNTSLADSWVGTLAVAVYDDDNGKPGNLVGRATKDVRLRLRTFSKFRFDLGLVTAASHDIWTSMTFIGNSPGYPSVHIGGVPSVGSTTNLVATRRLNGTWPVTQSSFQPLVLHIETVPATSASFAMLSMLAMPRRRR